jgi:hypothetical protein
MVGLELLHSCQVSRVYPTIHLLLLTAASTCGTHIHVGITLG